METQNTYRIIKIFLILLIFSSTNIFTQNKSIELDKLFTYYNQNGSFSGVVLAAESGQIIYKKAFGFSDFENKKVLDTSAVFNIASTTKPFTAVAIMMLKEQELLSYDDKLLKFFPAFPSYAKDIKIRHLLTHTSGITDYENDMHLSWKVPVMTTGLVYDSLIAQPFLNFSPGEKYSYSNSGYFLLALIIEKVSGKSYREFMEENIFKPLGMNHSYTYDEQIINIPNRVNAYVGYWQKNEDDLNMKVPGDGNIYTTASDLFLFEQALYSNRLLQQTTIAEAYDTTGLFTIKKNELKYGFGWNIIHDSSGYYTYHPGALGGFRCQLWRNLDKKQTLIILSNNTFLQSCAGVLSGAQNIMKDKPYALGGIPITELFYKNFYLKGFNMAMKKIKKAKASNDSTFSFSENEINNLGLDFLFFKKDPFKAVEIFNFNVELYAESWNAYDSLGEGYLQIDNNKLAIEAFEKSLKLNPENTNASSRLKQLEVIK